MKRNFLTIKVGEKINKLTLIELLDREEWVSKRPSGRFKYECGNEKIITINNVKNQNCKSCGCGKGKSAKIGEKHNSLTLIQVKKEGTKNRWQI